MNEEGSEIERDMAFDGGLARAISQALNYQKSDHPWHQLRQAWADKSGSCGLVVKQILKIVRWGLTH